MIRVSRDVLSRQLQHDCTLIAASFDSLCKDDVAELSALMSEALTPILGALEHAEDGRAIKAAAAIFLNAAHAISGAVYLLRGGFRLTPGAALRNALDSIATALHLLLKPDSAARIASGTLSIEEAVASADSAVPAFGRMYPVLAGELAQIGRLHLVSNPVIAYEPGEDALKVNLVALRASAWLLYVCAEFSFFEYVAAPRYWRFRAPDRLVYGPSTEEHDWQCRFLGSNLAI
jgi:hypothetical protein